MSNQSNQNGQPKKQKSEFVQACNAVKMSIKGRLARAHVLSLFDFQNKGNPKHSTYLIVDPNDPKVHQLMNIAGNLKQQFYPNVPDLLWNHPVKDGRQPVRPNGDPWQEWQKGKLFIACSTGPDFPPAALVRDVNSPKGYRDATLLDERSVFYDGAEAVVEFALGGMEGNNKGINLYFNGILGLGTGERIVISSGNSFNADDAFKEFLGATAGNTQNFNQQPQYNQGQQNYANSQGQYYQGNGAQQGMGQYGGQGNTQGYGNQNPSNNGQNAQNGAYPSNNGYTPNQGNNGGYNGGLV